MKQSQFHAEAFYMNYISKQEGFFLHQSSQVLTRPGWMSYKIWHVTAYKKLVDSLDGQSSS